MALPQAGVALIAEGADQYFATMGKASDAVSRFGDSAGQNAGKLSSFEQIGVGALRSIGGAAVDFAGRAAGAVVGFAQDSVKAAGDFQSGMLEFQAVAGKDVDTAGLDKFKNLFIGLGRDLPVSTAEVQQAAIELVKGGIDPATVAAGGLKQSIQFAAAAMGGDLAGAAEVSAKIVGGWAEVNATAADKAALLAHGTDLLTKAANASTVDVHDLALGLYNVQGTAKTAGLSLDETTTALAEMAPRFSNANTAGTAFRNFLVRLQPTTKPATEAMNELGLMTTSTTKVMQYLQAAGIQPLGTDLDTLGNQFSAFAASQGFTAKETDKVWSSFAQSKFFDETTGKFIGVAAASDLLKNATSDLTDAQKVQALQTIFGNDAMNAAAAFADMGAQGYTNMAAALDKANGVQDNATLKQSGLNTAMENFHGSIEALQITVGTALLPVLTSLFNDVLAPAVNTVTNLAGAVFGDQTAFDALSPSLQSTATTIQGVISGVGDFLAQNQPLIDQVKGNLIPILGALGAVIVGTVIVALGSMLAPFAATAAAIAAAIAIGAALYAAWNSNFMGIQTVVNSVITAVQTIITSVMSSVAAFWAANGDQIMASVMALWPPVQAIITGVITIVAGIVSAQLSAIAGFWQAHGDQVMTLVGYVFNTILGIIQTVLNVISGIVTAITQAMTGDWSAAGQTLVDTSNQFWSDIGGVFSNAVSAMATAAQLVVDAIVDTFNGLISSAASIGHDIINGIKSGIESAASSLAHAAADAAKSALDAAKSALGINSPSKAFQVEVGQPSVAGIIKGLTDMQPALNATMSDLIQPSMVRPVASGAQIAGASVTNNYYGQVGNSYQMPVYTSQNPNVVQHSFALAHAWSVR